MLLQPWKQIVRKYYDLIIVKGGNVMPTINWRGKQVKAISTRFKNIREEWNEYELEDGSTLRMKTVVSDVVRIPDEYDNENNPIYVVKSTNMVVANSPDHLKKKS
jgi:hypothetical protein